MDAHSSKKGVPKREVRTLTCLLSSSDGVENGMSWAMEVFSKWGAAAAVEDMTSGILSVSRHHQEPSRPATVPAAGTASLTLLPGFLHSQQTEWPGIFGQLSLWPEKKCPLIPKSQVELPKSRDVRKPPSAREGLHPQVRVFLDPLFTLDWPALVRKRRKRE